MAALLDRARPLDQNKAACLQTEWLLGILLLDCDGAVSLAAEDKASLAAESVKRLASDQPAMRKFAQGLSPETLRCVIWATIPSEASDADTAACWGSWLVAILGNRGSFEQVEPAELEALRLWVRDWPLAENGWWRHLWSSFPREGDLESIHVRLAIYETLHSMLSASTWRDRMRMLAGLEDWNDPTGSFALRTLGTSLLGHLSADDFLACFESSSDSKWRLALMMAFPAAMKWPRKGHADVPLAVRQALVEMRDSGSHADRMQVLERQWELLGATEALADLERFVAMIEPAPDTNWYWEAAFRVHGALEALAGDRPAEDGATLERAGALLRHFFLAVPPAHAAQVIDTLRAGPWGTMKENEQVIRAVLAETLGPDVLGLLPAELQAWVRS